MPSPPEHGSLRNAFDHFRSSDEYWLLPFVVRNSFQKIAAWLPDREALLPLAEINASSAKRLRDKAARERGWKFGNMTLVLIQVLVARAVETEILTSNRVRQVSKLPPPHRQPTSHRRHIEPVRHRAVAPTSPKKKKNST
jgi:hypothetical protein